MNASSRAGGGDSMPPPGPALNAGASIAFLDDHRPGLRGSSVDGRAKGMGMPPSVSGGGGPEPTAPPPPTGGTSEPPYDPPMHERVVKLEEFAGETRERLARIETKLDAVATKAELHDMKADLVKWIVATAVGLGAAGITVMTFVLNNAIPKSPTTAIAPQQPIIINVPSAAAPQPAPAPTPPQPK